MASKYRLGMTLLAIASVAVSIAALQIYACDSASESGDSGTSDAANNDGGNGGGDGGKTCDDYKNACLMGLNNGCFNPTGACVVSGIKEAKWDNGAKITFQMVGTSAVIVTWFGSSGKQCYYANAPLSMQDNYVVTITTSDAKLYVMSYTKADSSVTVTCPNATVEKYNQTDFDVLTQCYGGQYQDMIKNCTWDKELCKTDLDCLLNPLGNQCCDKYGIKICSKSCT